MSTSMGGARQPFAGDHVAIAGKLGLFSKRDVRALVERLERRVAFSLSVTDRELYLSIGSDTLTGAVVRLNRA